MPNHPFYSNSLVECTEVEELLNAGARPVQIDIDPEAYDQGHLPGAIPWHWETQLRNPETQQILTKVQFEELMAASGIEPDTKVLLYGDNNNWFACWGFWLMKLYGHENVWLLDGGLRKWLSSGCPVTDEKPVYQQTSYTAKECDLSNKATTENIFGAFFDPAGQALIDVRSSAEFEGRLRSPGAGMEAKCSIAGHIPNAINIPWNLNCKADGTFKDPDELSPLYESFGVTRDKSVITYCAIGERSSLGWFVLKYLLDYKVVMNYDQSMAQWCRLPNAPIEVGAAA
jgi:thiosulfate/3-mercaptopyruvate sulfurtransferase